MQILHAAFFNVIFWYFEIKCDGYLERVSKFSARVDLSASWYVLQPIYSDANSRKKGREQTGQDWRPEEHSRRKENMFVSFRKSSNANASLFRVLRDTVHPSRCHRRFPACVVMQGSWTLTLFMKNCWRKVERSVESVHGFFMYSCIHGFMLVFQVASEITGAWNILKRTICLEAKIVVSICLYRSVEHFFLDLLPSGITWFFNIARMSHKSFLFLKAACHTASAPSPSVVAIGEKQKKWATSDTTFANGQKWN